MSRFYFPRFQDFIFIIIFIGALVIGDRMLNTDSDIGRDITIGNYILGNHKIPNTNILSFTKPDEPRPPYEWLAQVLFSISNRLLNLDGVVLLTALIIAAGFSVVYFDSQNRSSLPITSLILTLWSAAASSIHWLSRPHIFSFLFFAIWIQWLERIRNGRKFPLWVFPGLMLVWANTHGGFLFGLLAWFAYFGGWLWEWSRRTADKMIGRNLFIIGGSSLVASIITPDLWQNWHGVLNNNNIYILSHTSETLPPNPFIPGTLPFFGLLGLTLLMFINNKRRTAANQYFLLFGFGLISLTMARNIPFFVISTVPILSVWIENFSNIVPAWSTLENGFLKIDAKLQSYFWSILIVLASVGLMASYQFRNLSYIYQFDAKKFPVEAINWVADHPLKGNMFNDFNWGGYILYRLWPSEKVFIDSQSDFYGETITRRYASILNGEENWDKELEEFNVDWIIVSPQTGLSKVVNNNSFWQLTYHDAVTVIYVRK
jgi:hypothetical protein